MRKLNMKRVAISIAVCILSTIMCVLMYNNESTAGRIIYFIFLIAALSNAMALGRLFIDRAFKKKIAQTDPKVVEQIEEKESELYDR